MMNHALVVSRKRRSNRPNTLRSGRNIVITTRASSGATSHADPRDGDQEQVDQFVIRKRRRSDSADQGERKCEHSKRAGPEPDSKQISVPANGIVAYGVPDRVVAGRQHVQRNVNAEVTGGAQGTQQRKQKGATHGDDPS